MVASAANPIYTVHVVTKTRSYNVTSLLIDMDIRESKNQIAQSVTLNLYNHMVEGTWLSNIIKVRDRVVVLANDGTQSQEVFRGFIWDRDYHSSLSNREISLKCYDNLIYLQKSEINEFFEGGKTTREIVQTLCDDWGIKLVYSYDSITHEKLVLRGNLADILTSDILDIVKDRSGHKYSITSYKDVITIKRVTLNKAIYRIVAGKNVISTKSHNTMDGVVTKIVIYGKAGKDDRPNVDATLSENTDEYGTIQKIISRSENETIEAATEEAQNILDNNSVPKNTYEVQAPDIPWIRKGDMVFVDAGDIKGKYLIVTDVDRFLSSREKKMTLGLEDR